MARLVKLLPIAYAPVGLQWWWRYYSQQLDGGALIFIGWILLYKAPRALQGEECFMRALGFIEFL